MKMNIKAIVISFMAGTFILSMYGSSAFAKSDFSHKREGISKAFKESKLKEKLKESMLVSPEEIAMLDIQDELLEEKRTDLREEIKEEIASNKIEDLIEMDHMP